MLERRTALQALEWPSVSEAHITLHEIAVAGAWLICDWDEAGERTITNAVREAGLAPQVPLAGQALSTASTLLASIGPDRYLVITADEAAADSLERAVTGAHSIECQCQRAWLRLSGHGSRAFLDRRLGVDISHGRFPAGCAAATRLGQVDVLVHAGEDGSFDLLPARSFAAALAETLWQSASAEGLSLAICPVQD